MDDPLVALTLITALGCGLNAGVFFAFSSFVMRGLTRLQPAQGIAAMQSINATAVTPAFMTALFGTALGCLSLAVWALVDWDGSFGPYLLTGSGLYLLGTVGLTIVFHVPRNDALAAVEPRGGEAPGWWRQYAGEWTRVNHVRAAAAMGGAGALTIALLTG